MNNNDNLMSNNETLMSNHEWVTMKTEPHEEDYIEETTDNIKEEKPDSKSIVLKFKKETNGEYSVIPLLTPDPFYEVNLEDDKTSIVKIKEEPEDDDNNNNNKLVKSYCARCTLYADDELKLRKHQQRVHPIKPKSCPFCNECSFKEPLSVQMHLLFRHRDNEKAMQLITRPIFCCSECGYSSLKKNNYKRHLLTHQPKKDKKDINRGNKYNCYHCAYGVNDKGSIIKHVRLHKSNDYKPHLCTECNTKYNEKSSLDSHIVKRHLDNERLFATLTNRIYECDYCNYKDVNKAKVLRHKRRHSKKEYYV